LGVQRIVAGQRPFSGLRWRLSGATWYTSGTHEDRKSQYESPKFDSTLAHRLPGWKGRGHEVGVSNRLPRKSFRGRSRFARRGTLRSVRTSVEDQLPVGT